MGMYPLSNVISPDTYGSGKYPWAHREKRPVTRQINHGCVIHAKTRGVTGVTSSNIAKKGIHGGASSRETVFDEDLADEWKYSQRPLTRTVQDV